MGLFSAILGNAGHANKEDLIKDFGIEFHVTV
jgi:hypothetical protein